MKKVIVISLLLCLCLSLCACGKSKAAQAVDDLILSIGDVTLSDKNTINDTKNQYDQLSEKEKQSIENYELLEESIDKLAALEEAEAIRKEEEARLKAEKEKQANNYLKLLQWLADNGDALTSGDINNYGQIVGYDYYFEDPTGDCTIRVKLNKYGKFTDSTPIEIKRLDRVKEDSVAIYSIDQNVKFTQSSLELSYTWQYESFILKLVNNSTCAQGFIFEEDFSQMTRANSDYPIENYEATMTFKNVSGYSDVRAEINNDLFETMDLFEKFLVQEIGLTLADIGFTSYS